MSSKLSLFFNYTEGLYRKNNYGEPCVWYLSQPINGYSFVYYGILGKTLNKSTLVIKNDTEYNRKIADKRKVGYKFLNEVRDNQTFPVEEELIGFLSAYLPNYRDTSDGTILPMLAKTYDNTNNKIFKKGTYLGQYKINGLRCFIRIEKSDNIFRPYRLTFQSREGTFWNSLVHLENELINIIGETKLEELCEEHIILDGELYIPGLPVNEINSAVKNTANPYNRLVQYWMYDIAIENISQNGRNNIILEYFRPYFKRIVSKEEHIRNTYPLVVLPNYYIDNDNDAINFRDAFIKYGFEGLIMRNINAEYQFGKRLANTMIKYKATDDGIFEIIDIYPEDKRDIPLIKCKNDINDATFECHLNGTFDYQKSILNNRDKYIGSKLFISFAERSGKDKVPFHLKTVKLV